MRNFLHHLKSDKLSKKIGYLSCIILSLFFIATFQSYGQVSGIVFNDNNSNGVRNFSRPNEKAIEGVTIKAFVGSSSTPIIKLSSIDGSYSFSAGEIPAGSKVRLEFISDEPGASSGLAGTSSQSTVQFITAPATDVSIGLLLAQDYCQVKVPYFAIPCYVTGDPLISTGDITKDAGEGDALVAFDYMATGLASATNFPPVHLGLAKDIGAVWGITYHGRTNHVISAAIVKRHAGLGILGTGGLYKTNVLTGEVSPYLDVKTIGIDTGPDPHIGLPADKNAQSADPVTYTKVGKVGIGGTDISIDGKFYYFSNLYDKKIYRINTGKDLSVLPTAADVKSYPYPNGGCSNNDYSTWSVTCDGPVVYASINCTAETSQQLSDLKAVVYKLDTASGVFTEMISFPLDFIRGSADRTGLCVNNKTWKPWTNTFPAPCDGNFVMYPQPILSDVYFDNNGHMLLGFMDRFGHQAGAQMPDLNGNGSYLSFMGGDLMRAYRNADDTFSLENNGSAGPLVGSGVGNGQGIGGGEFFADDEWRFYGNVAHDEVLNGGVLVMPGYDEVLSTSFDPINEVFMSSGWQVYNVNNGESIREFAVFGESDTNKPYERNGTFGKAAALGSGRALCDPAPIEVGNRIWIDTDIDGVQDPDELGIDGVEVLICDAATNEVVGKDTTTNGGRYYFNSQNVITNATNKGLEYEKNYVIKIPKNQTVLARFQKITSKDLGSSDLIDSDGQEDATSIFVAFKTGDIGQTNHTYDFGLIECIKLDSLVISACDKWTNTYRANVYVAYNNSPIKNLHLVLTKPDGTVLKDSIVVPTTTANHQMIALQDLSSNGLAGMKISVNIVGSESDLKCKIDTTYNAPAQCTATIPGQFLDPVGFIYCEETGQIIKGATVELLGPKPAIVLEDGSNGEYRFMIAPNAYGIYTLKINIPAGYQASTTCLISNDTLQLDGKPNPFIIGNTVNADSTFMTTKECTVFYKSFNIQFGSPIILFNNIPLKGCCVKPIAGADTSLCNVINTTTINLKDALPNETWSIVAGNPADATIDPSTGVVSGLSATGKYQFQLTFGIENSTCKDTIAIMVGTNPNYTATAASPTCTDGTPISNGSITLANFGTNERFAFSEGVTYTGTANYATATAIPSSGIIVANLPNPSTASQDYTVRVFNAEGCSKDITVSISKAITNCCTVLPNAGNDSSFCLLSKTSVDLIDALAGETWSASATNPAETTITATTGIASGFSLAGTYKFILSNTLGGQSCRDTVVIIVNDKPDFTANTTTTTCLNNLMQSNGKLTLATFGIADRYAYSTGSTYTGTAVSYATATAIPTSGIIADNLSNPSTASQDYTIRVFNATGCYKDITVQLLKSTAACCPNAGNDQTFCLLSKTSVDLIDALAGESWSASAANPAGTTITESTGIATGFSLAGTYKFILSNTLGGQSCHDTVAIMVLDNPNFTANTTTTTCLNNLMQSNGKLTLAAFGIADRYAYSTGSTYTGTAVSYATATAIPASGIIADNLSNPSTASQDYTIRVFNATGCYKDITVQLLKSTAACCPIAGKDSSLCLLSTTTVDLIDALAGESWSAFDTGTDSPRINATTGLVTGLLKSGAFKFILKNSTCADTITIKVITMPMATAVASQTSCAGGVMQSNGELRLVDFDPTERFDFTLGSTYTGTATTYNSGASIPNSGTITNTLPNPNTATQDYTIRVFNASECYKDIIATLNRSTAVCCQMSSAGKDTTVCGTTSTSINLNNAIGSERWAVVAGNPAAATIDELTGDVSNLTMDGTYKFQLVASATCRDTISVTVGMKPTFTATTTKATCSNGTPAANGMITLSNFTAAHRFAFVKGSSYNGTVSTFANAAVIPASGIITTSLLNPSTATEDYTIRVFNATGCYSDLTVQLQKAANCCSTPACVPFLIIKRAK